MTEPAGKINSHSFVYSDFDTAWYKNWAKKLKQTEKGKGKFYLRANKFWQNAVMVQALYERGGLEKGNSCIGFGVGKERLPALFASMGIDVTATDQDFTKAKAKLWKNDQLAEGAFSLNEDGICKPEVFAKKVDFIPLDMTKIPKRLHGKYDFLWSNCALGHLGSIKNGLKFIKQSLECLQPGGWAVHTTEFNILSNTETVTGGDTVIFRAIDIYNLNVELTKLGYIVTPFEFTPGHSKQDARVALRPAWGNDNSKIFVGGHIITQIVLIIHKPETQMSKIKQKIELAKHYKVYRHNLRAIKKIGEQNPTLKLLRKTQNASISDYKIRLIKKNVTGRAGDKKIIIEYENKSELPLTGVYESLFGAKPISLATNDPVNHDSTLATKSWFKPNRPTSAFYKWTNSTWQPAEYIKPGEKFGFVFEINKGRKKSDQKESFVLLQEGGGIITESAVDVI